MGSVQKSFTIIKRLNMDFQIVLQAKNEEEALYNAGLTELEHWNEIDADWQIVNISRIPHLVIAKDKPDSVGDNTVAKKPTIQIWKTI
jgi:hypothetical protein